MRVSIVSNETQSYTLTGEWFNSTDVFSPATFIPNSNFTGTFKLEGGYREKYYFWRSINQPDEISKVGFMVTLRADNGQVLQDIANLTLVRYNSLTPFLGKYDVAYSSQKDTLFKLTLSS